MLKWNFLQFQPEADKKTIRENSIDTLIALCPAAVAGVVLFGPAAALVLLTCTFFAWLCALIWNRIFKEEASIFDLNTIIIGVVLGLTLPSKLPLWLAALAGIVSVLIFKAMLRYIGQFWIHPVLVTRVLIAAVLPAFMRGWSEPFAWLNETADTLSGATPLSTASSYTLKDLFMGVTPGSIGETCALLLLVGGLYLVLRRVISPVIPLAMITTTGIFSWIAGESPLVSVLSGGLIFATVFIAADYRTTPLTDHGKLVFGVGCGLLTFVLRYFTPLAEGVALAVLIMELIAPFINKLFSLIAAKRESKILETKNAEISEVVSAESPDRETVCTESSEEFAEESLEDDPTAETEKVAEPIEEPSEESPNEENGNQVKDENVECVSENAIADEDVETE